MKKPLYLNPKIRNILTLLIIISIFISITACSKGDGEADPNGDEFSPSSSLVMTEADAKLLNENIKITVYFIDQDGKALLSEVRNMKIDEAKKSPANIATAIVNELLKGPSSDSKAKRCIPEGTKLLEAVKISGTTAIVNLSKEFVDKNTGDKNSIEMCIYSLVNSVTEIKELDMVKILIDGKEVKDIKGVVKMNLPFKRNKSLISIQSIENTKKTDAEIYDEVEILE